MSFVANRDLRVEAFETAGGFTLRTVGLAKQRRPELEIAGVPEAGLQAAGGVINIVAEYSVNDAEVLEGQSVGNVLTVGDDGRRLVLALRAVAAEKPKGGLWAKLAGGGKGLLRLVDVDARGDTGPPLTALATMLVHRAAVRLSKDDEAGARDELCAAIDVFPGQPDAGRSPSIDGADGVFNWQNHLAYLDLAGLAEAIPDAARRFGEALARSESLARKELGAPLAALRAAPGDAARVLERNFASTRRQPGPNDEAVVVASPVWEAGDTAGLRRHASLVPAAFLALYYEGEASLLVRRSGAALAEQILDLAEPWRAAWIARQARGVWVSDAAGFVEVVDGSTAGDAVVSLLLADVARCFHAGATEKEILERYGAARDGDQDGGQPAVRALAAKLDAQAIWENEAYMRAFPD